MITYPESAQYLADNPADLTGTDKPGGFAVQVETDQAVQGEVQFPHPVEGPMDLAVQRQGLGRGARGRKVWRRRRQRLASWQYGVRLREVPPVHGAGSSSTISRL